MTPPFTTADDAWTVRAWRDDLHVALSLLTRLPVGAPPAAACLSERPKRTFPLVAAFMGLAAGGAFFVAHDAGLPLVVNTVLCVAALLLLGGHVDDHGHTASAPLMVATMMKLAAVYVLGSPMTPGGGPAMVVVALAGAGALSQAAAILLEPDGEDEADVPAEAGAVDPKVVILPPDGTQITEDEMDEGNGRALGAPTTAILIALIISILGLGLMPTAVAAGGAMFGAFIAPRLLARDIEAEVLATPLAMQQSGEVWALLALAVLLSA